jgi:hypothetical protein
MWKLSVRTRKHRSNAADNTCWPRVLLHVIEAPRPVDLAATDLANSQRPDTTCAMRAVLAIDHVSHDAAPPSVPVSNGWPPDVG